MATKAQQLLIELFNELVKNNDYYSSIRQVVKDNEQNIDQVAYDLYDDYTDNCDFLSVYSYLDHIENELREGGYDTVDDVLAYLWETGW